MKTLALVAALALGACTADGAAQFAGALGALGAGMNGQPYYGQPYYTGSNRPVACNSVGGYTQCR